MRRTSPLLALGLVLALALTACGAPAPEASARMLLFMGIPYFGLSAEPALGWCQASVRYCDSRETDGETVPSVGLMERQRKRRSIAWKPETRCGAIRWRLR